MTWFVDKNGIVKKQVKVDTLMKEDFWMAEFIINEAGGEERKCHYCNDYKVLRHFVEMCVGFYNKDVLSEGLSEKDMNEILIKEISTDKWESVNVHATISRTTNATKKVIASKLKKGSRKKKSK